MRPLADVSWLPGVAVPTGWQRKRVKHVLRDLRAGEGITAEDIESSGDYPVYGGNGVRGYTSHYTHSGTFVLIGRQGALCGNVHLASGRFWASEHAMVGAPAIGVDPRWLAYTLRTMNLGQYSVTAAQPGIGVAQVMALDLYAPRPEEQRAIADFLDEQTSRIDTLINKQTQLIITLQERRRAAIAHGVTKGLTPGTKLRPSGLRWAGDVPDTWEVANIRRYAAMKTGHTPSRSEPAYWIECDIPWVTLADVGQLRDGRTTYLSSETQAKISAVGLANSAAELLPAGTVVLSRTASVGFSGIMPVPMATSQDYWNWVCGPRLLPAYLLATFRAMKDEFRSMVMGSTHKTIYQPVAAGMTIVVPPIEEQRAIVAHLNDETSSIDALIDKTEQHIALARERRAALIAAAVTGQINVRTAGRATQGVV
ncbi:type I restriction enzyme S subunit [Micromonospora palomenae]|uniref:Type I restriction enzyme S subunit n=2 Tax=Micromonospora palomenae TaxID=1461247 RepID=A0A561WWL5_9ACTN|nr:type I restriction enzyme S subunit [Micromonospora palomenae]